jgi:16S rRNA U516 pseudouridylate synthase RsuA-like enzyme
MERLQKLMAQAGLGSRRANEELIVAGRVRVNGRVARLGDKADPAQYTNLVASFPRWKMRWKKGARQYAT